MSRHADAVLATTENGNATSLIATSWRRCVTAHRLDPDSYCALDRDLVALREAEERDQTLIAVARPYLDQLFAGLGDPYGSTALGDRNGLATQMRFGGSQDVHESRPWRLLGVVATEAALGTNGFGTCLAEQRPVVVDGDDHFLSSLTAMVCFAAPIFAPDGSLAGCLNATVTKARGKEIGPFVQMVVRSFAKRIEIELFAAAFPRTRLVLASDVGRNASALLAIDPDGIVRGATRAARRLLALDGSDLERGFDYDALCGFASSERLVDRERKLVARTLARHGGNVTRTAKELGISRSSVYRKAGVRKPDELG